MSYEVPSHFFKVCFYTLDGITTSEVEGHSFTIGRSEKCDLQIESASISRKHLKVSIKNAVIFVEDLGSSAGTIISDKKLEPKTPVRYRQGDLIQIGKSEIFVTVNSGTVANVILNEPDLSEKVVDVMHSSQVTRKLKGWLEQKVGKDGFNLGASLRHKFLKTIEELAQKEENIEYQAEDIIRASARIADKIKKKAQEDGRKILEGCHSIADQFQAQAQEQAQMQAQHIVDTANEEAEKLYAQIEEDKAQRTEKVMEEVESLRLAQMDRLEDEGEQLKAEAAQAAEEEKERIIDEGNKERRKRLSEIDKKNKEAEDRRKHILDEASKHADNIKRHAQSDADAKMKKQVDEAKALSDQMINTAKQEAQIIKKEAQDELHQLEAKLKKMENDTEWTESQLKELTDRKNNIQGEVEKVLNAADDEIRKAKQATQKEINRAMQIANNNADEIVDDAKEKAEKLVASGNAKAEKFMEKVKAEATKEKERVHKEAEAIKAEAHKDRERVLDSADKEKQLILKDAQVEHDEIVKTAKAEAKAQIADAKLENVKIEKEVQKLQGEQRKLEELMSQLNEKAGDEKERLDRLKSQQQEFAEVEKNLKSSTAALEKVTKDKDESERLLAALRGELHEKEDAVKASQQKMDALEKEQDELRQKIEFNQSKFAAESANQEKELAQHLAEENLKRMREIEQKAAEAERQFVQQRGEKIGRIANDIEMQLFGFFKRAGQPLEEQKGVEVLSKEIHAIVDNVLGEGRAKQKEELRTIVDYDPQASAKLKKFWIQAVVGGAAVVIAASLLISFKSEIQQAGRKLASTIDENPSATDIYMNTQIEKNRAAAEFNPEQSPDFKVSYTDNVIYTSDYISFENNVNLNDRWTLEIEDYFVEELELSESVVAKVLGSEAGMLKVLVDMYKEIDNRSAKTDIIKMRQVEAKFKADILKLLGEQKFVDGFLEKKKQFYESNCGCL